MSRMEAGSIIPRTSAHASIAFRSISYRHNTSQTLQSIQVPLLLRPPRPRLHIRGRFLGTKRKATTPAGEGAVPGPEDGVSLPPSGLWVVATPIGNLNDLTPRATLALQNADMILCEDTRRTSKLLYAIGMDKFHSKLHRADEHACANDLNIQNWVNAVKSGASVAIVSDAGTPAISDPGARLVRACIQKKNIVITPIPGVSAVATLLSICGFDETAFCFRGFFPRRLKEQTEEIHMMEGNPCARIGVWFESPRRIADTLRIVAATAKEESRVVAAKELTKKHERVFHGSPSEICDQVLLELERQGEIGEWCFAVQFPLRDEEEASISQETWHKAMQCLIESDVPVSEAAKKVSHVFQIPKNQAYDAAVKFKAKLSRTPIP